MGQAATPSAAKIPSATPSGVLTEGRAPTRLGKAQVWREHERTAQGTRRKTMDPQQFLQILSRQSLKVSKVLPAWISMLSA